MIETFVIRSREQLQDNYSAIALLFEECFNAPLSMELWRWLYMDGPGRQPFVALAMDGDRAVGHYGVISMPTRDEHGETLNSYLSITSMVAASHRKLGLFASLGLLSYEEAKQAGVDFIMGFPNKLAIPGRRKKLGWQMPEPDYVAPLEKDEILALANAHSLFDGSGIHFDWLDESLRNWRLAKPGVKYVSTERVAYKDFGSAIDLVYCDGPEGLSDVPDGKPINVLLPGAVQVYKSRSLFEYQYGGVGICKEFDPSRVERQLIMSDVF
ncbi:GNAT family N-acetyltransferase [Achromobacter animicus]|uniref:GNAT family N-acetyltransferase n=1 Tax=Achromobacter animicus TaxID=1389935 RepID=UPI0028AF139E|nr:GNAT family N-acetyltransferase [Achromobacter animicus]